MYKPNYTITDEMLRKVAEIEALRSQIASSRILPEREVEMRYRATVEATHSSTSIEGNPLNGKQVERVLSEASAPQPTRRGYAETEVKNYKKALDFIDRRKSEKSPIGAEDVLAVHRIITNGLLPPEKSGAWRKNPVYIENQDGETVYDGPPAKIVPLEIAGLLEWLNGEGAKIHPVLASGIFHIQFVSIHPFADGNGRCARALTTLCLGHRGYDFRGSLVLDSYYSTDKSEYYRAIHESQGSHYGIAKTVGLNPWLEYFTDGFLSSAKALSAEVAILASVLGAWDTAKRIGRDEADLLDYARQFGSLALSEAEGILDGASRRTIQRKLKRLVDEGYLEMRGSARSTLYVWKP